MDPTAKLHAFFFARGSSQSPSSTHLSSAFYLGQVPFHNIHLPVCHIHCGAISGSYSRAKARENVPEPGGGLVLVHLMM